MFARYFELLKHWNRSINLTALPLENLTDGAMDRLIIESLVAAEKLGDGASTWFDLGSGGGSPAIPMKIAWPATRLTMVESRSRKGAFLREAIRELGLTAASVAEPRFEDLARTGDAPGSADLVTVRAVRPDAKLFVAVHLLLKHGGRLAIFSSESERPSPEVIETDGYVMEEPFSIQAVHSLPGNSTLTVLLKEDL
jgi:16S rRNA (guanine527-N7)-methyltransferase